MSRTDDLINIIDTSSTKEKRAEYQVSTAFHESGILPEDAEDTKHEGMDANRQNGATNSHDVHQGTSIGWSTYHAYKSIGTALGAYCAEEYGVKSIYDIEPRMMAGFLDFAIGAGVGASTYDKYCSALEKVGWVINHNTGQDTDYHSTISDSRKSGMQEIAQPDQTARAYSDPHAIIDQLPSEKMQIVAELQLSCGLRVSDACYIKDWDGASFTAHSKNGQYMQIVPPAELASRISEVIRQDGKFSVSPHAYDYQLEKACHASGQEWHGTHGLRHNYAIDRMEEYTSKGMSYEKALGKVSEDMGHHRAEITKVYLR